ncbi:MAG: radical SAM protein [DPANN group archaeon]|nr:radical SAM protein [DPANN group archaeon]
MTDVVLVNLNRILVPPIAPYALDVLGSALRQEGHDVEILDLTLTDDPSASIDSYFQRSRPELVALTLRNTHDLYFPSFFDLPEKGSFLPEHHRLVDRIKGHIDPERIILGGVGFSSQPEALLHYLGLRYGVQGQGDQVLVELADGLSRGASLASQFAVRASSAGKPVAMGIAGDDGASVSADEVPLFIDGRATRILSKVDRSLVDNAWYYEHGGLGAIRTSHGCTMPCRTYCIEPEAKMDGYALVSLEDTLSEFDQLIGQRVHDIHSADSEFNIPFAHSKDVLRAIASRGYGTNQLRFWLYAQPSPFDEEYARLLSRANGAGINFGVDHTDRNMLRKMGKWYGLEEIAKATRLAQDNGIPVAHELLFGFPGDSPEKMFRSLDDIQALDPHVVGVSLGVAVLPGTALGRAYLEKVLSGEPTPGFYHADDAVYADPAGLDGQQEAGRPSNGHRASRPAVRDALLGPVYYMDPSFSLPSIFEELHARIDVSRVMIPQLDSTGMMTNQLVGSRRLEGQLQEHRKGAYWFHYPESHHQESSFPVRRGA